ncbi:MAG: hypothetical protein Q8Q09_19105 [Deltaproteobacteria bacterium]|nr:hypothetical protein [Deltaproteobacteria bacterium]
MKSARLPLSLSLLTVLTVSTAHAQPATSPPPPRVLSPAEVSARRELVAQAQRAQRAGQHPEALALAERAAALQMTPSLRMFIAQTQRSVGRLADAMGNAELCEREAAPGMTLSNREEILRECTNLRESLAAEVARVVVQVATPCDGLEVHVGESTLAPTLYGLPYVVSAGAVDVSAQAPGHRVFARRVTVGRGESITVEITLERIPVVQQNPRDIITPPHPDPLPHLPRSVGPGPFVLMGLGGAGLVAGGVLWGLSASAAGALNSECTPMGATRVCPGSVNIDDRVNGVNGLALGAVIAGSAGAALALGGVLWFALAPRGHAHRESIGPVSFAVMPTGRGAAVSVGGAF